MIWYLDWCNLGDEFPVFFYHIREEREEEHRQWHEFNRIFGNEQQQQDAARATEATSPTNEGGAASTSGWRQSLSNSATSGIQSNQCCSALVPISRSSPRTRRNRRATRCSGARSITNLGACERSLRATRSLVELVVRRFCQALDSVVERRSDLTEQWTKPANQLGPFANSFADKRRDRKTTSPSSAALKSFVSNSATTKLPSLSGRGWGRGHRFTIQ